MTEYYLTTDRDPQGDGYLAVITQGHPRHGDAECYVCDVGRFTTVKAAERWFKAQTKIEPWRTSDGDKVPL